MTRVLWLAGTVLVSGLMPSGLKAQELLPLGTRLRVTYSVIRDRRLLEEFSEGHFLGMSQDSVLMLKGVTADTVGIPMYWVNGVEQIWGTSGDRSGGGAKFVGVMIGGTLGAVYASKQPKCGDNCWFISDEASTAMTVLYGAVIGMAVAHAAFGPPPNPDPPGRVTVPMSAVRNWLNRPTDGLELSQPRQPDMEGDQSGG